MTAKTTESDRENGSSGKRLRNEFLENSMIFRVFSSKIPRFSPIFSDFLRYSPNFFLTLRCFYIIIYIKVWKEKSI